LEVPIVTRSIIGQMVYLYYMLAEQFNLCLQLVSFCSLALRVISAAVGNRAQQLPLSQLAGWFACSTADVEVLCSACGFTVNENLVSVARPKFQQPQRVRNIISS